MADDLRVSVLRQSSAKAGTGSVLALGEESR
jgi:hypothetical protein